MKIIVPIKRVVDHKVKVRPLEDGRAVDLRNTKMTINPFCEIALEEAVRIKESGFADEVIAISIGEVKAQEQLRSAMAMGADRGILITTKVALEPLALAKCLNVICEKERPDLIILGKQSIDGDNNQVGQSLAALMGVAQGTFASKLELKEGKVLVTREVDGGLQTLSLRLPAVVTADLRLNEPRFISLPNIMKAKKKPLDIFAAEDLSVDLKPRTEVLGVSLPAQRSAGTKVSNVSELLSKLKSEAKVGL